MFAVAAGDEAAAPRQLSETDGDVLDNARSAADITSAAAVGEAALPDSLSETAANEADDADLDDDMRGASDSDGGDKSSVSTSDDGRRSGGNRASNGGSADDTSGPGIFGAFVNPKKMHMVKFSGQSSRVGQS